MLGKIFAVNGLGPRVIWKVKTSEMFVECKAENDFLDSPEFSMGVSKFSIRFYPLGQSISDDGKAGLYVVQQSPKELYFPKEAEVVLSAVGNEFAMGVSRPVSWKMIFDATGTRRDRIAGSGYRNFVDIADLRKASEITVSLRHSDGDNGRVIELGASAETHSTSTGAEGKSEGIISDRAQLEALRKEMTEMKEGCDVERAFGRARRAAKRSEQLKDAARTEQMKDAAVAAVLATTVVFLAIVVIRK